MGTNFLIIFCFSIFAYGVSNMVCYAEGPWGIFEWWRQVADRISTGFGKLFNCMMCFSTWVGFILSVIDFFLPVAITPFNILLAGSGLWWLIPILDAGFTSGVVWLIHNFEEACERHGIIEYMDEDNGNRN